jgi:hypothetical protein
MFWNVLGYEFHAAMENLSVLAVPCSVYRHLIKALPLTCSTTDDDLFWTVSAKGPNKAQQVMENNKKAQRRDEYTINNRGSRTQKLRKSQAAE